MAERQQTSAQSHTPRIDGEELEFFATCAFGLERFLAVELKRMRMHRVRPLKGGVAFFATQQMAYRACLWSRLASRVLRVFGRVDARDDQALYESVKSLDWVHAVAPGATIAVAAGGSNAQLRNTKFTALRVKDAVCDALRAARGERPDVQVSRPDVPIRVRVNGGKAVVYLDYAGEPLSHRGYRQDDASVAQGISETLAAAVLVWGGWSEVGGSAEMLVDAACGAGTLALEAAAIAADRAPGLSRDYWGFAGLADFDADAFDAVLDEADERFERGLEALPGVLGIDVDARAIDVARACAKRLGFGGKVAFIQADCACLPQVLADLGVADDARGIVVADTPYGVHRTPEERAGFAEHLSRGVCGLGESWELLAVAADAGLDTALGMDAQAWMELRSGSVETTARRYRLGSTFRHEMTLDTLDGRVVSVAVSSEHAGQFAARLRKVAKARRKWARKEDIHAFRLYDADLPDYAVAIDLFEEDGTGELSLLVTEYQAPKEIDPQKALRRFTDAVTVSGALLSIPPERVFTRVRKQARGGSQYSRDEHAEHTLLVREGGHVFELNLEGYLDTGLFLDHRVTRGMVQDMAAETRFLNLFAYTGSATVYAAAGDALTTTTVDMSQTYLDWARRNLQRNVRRGKTDRFIRADVLQWLEREARTPNRYDLVFVDPPTFSNSKSMGERTWDIQRDHVSMLAGVSKILVPGARVVFSGNLRSFKLDAAALGGLGFAVQDITAQTIPQDFERNKRIHFCFLLTFSGA